MINQQPPTVAIAELGAKFGAQQAQTFADLVVLEKIVGDLNTQIQAMTKREKSLIENIRELEIELNQLKELKPVGMSKELQKRAKEGKEVIRGE